CGAKDGQRGVLVARGRDGAGEGFAAVDDEICHGKSGRGRRNAAGASAFARKLRRDGRVATKKRRPFARTPWKWERSGRLRWRRRPADPRNADRRLRGC